MRLGFAVFSGPSAGLVRNASQFDGFGRIQAISGRLRRILDHASGKTSDPPETQTHFGPPSSQTTGPLSYKTPDHQASVPQDPGPPSRRATGRSNAPTNHVPTPANNVASCYTQGAGCGTPLETPRISNHAVDRTIAISMGIGFTACPK